MKSFQPRLRGFIGVFILLALTEAVYLRPSILQGSATLFGSDYMSLHIRRIAFARDALFGARHTLPAWYPHEAFGSPFNANLQSFPWIPTRFALFLFDPALAFAAGVAIAAALAAVFMYLYCRRAGLSEVGSASAAWTFACAGFFTSRLTAGHLPLLEAYPALPLLLWFADRALSAERVRKRALDLAVLACAGACVALAGHPQVPAYAIAVALLYVVLRGRGWLRAKVVCAIALGLGATLFAWSPMLSLIGRSTRVLSLENPDNDISMPYGRLLALVSPGIDGWPDILDSGARNPFHGYDTNAYFWDTASYVGILPLIAATVLLILCVARKRLPGWPWIFLAAVGAGALLYALPLSTPLRQLIPGTLLRSPARLLYISTFSISVALGAGIDAFLRSALLKPRARQAIVAFCLVLHCADLSGFARATILVRPPEVSGVPELDRILAREIGDGRIAAGDDLLLWTADRYDDVGGFDSIFLANSYRAILALAGAPPGLNVQSFDGISIPVPALQAIGVRFVLTSTARSDLEPAGASQDVFLYRVPDSRSRAAYFAAESAEFMPARKILDVFVAQPRRERLLLPEEAREYLPPATAGAARDHATISYGRPSSDEIVVHSAAGKSGFVHVLEAFDPGWAAEVDGARAPVVLANGFTMAVPVSPGSHTVRLRYHTPGRTAGIVLSLLSVCLLAVLAWRERKAA